MPIEYYYTTLESLLIATREFYQPANIVQGKFHHWTDKTSNIINNPIRHTLGSKRTSFIEKLNSFSA